MTIPEGKEPAPRVTDVASSDLVETAWLAGYVDGEGYVGWDRTARLRISNTHRPTLAALCARYGGSVYPKKRVYRHRPAYSWELTGPRARALLTLLLPFLREKREQAELVLSVPKASTSRLMSDAELAHRVEVRRKLRELRHAAS